jgi:membrane-associated phospholipid phosphatase
MRNFWENPWFTIPVLLFFAIGFGIVYTVPYGDELIFFNSWRQEPLNTFFRFCSRLGEEHVYYVAIIIAFFFRFRTALLIALLGIFVTSFSFTLKDYFGTERPMTYMAGQGRNSELRLVPDVRMNTGRTSFPSGHTMSAFAFYGFLAMLLRRREQWLGGILAYTAILVGIARIFLVQHFLLDILGGALLGLGVAWLFYRLHESRYMQQFKFLNRGLKKLKSKEIVN